MKRMVGVLIVVCLFGVVNAENKSRNVSINHPTNVTHLVKIEKNFKEFNATLIARKFAQGEVILVKIKENEKIKCQKILWGKKEYPISRFGKEWIGFIPVDPEYANAKGNLEIFFRKGFKTNKNSVEVAISKTKFKEYNSLNLPSKFTSNHYSKEVMAFIKKCNDLKRKAFSKYMHPIFSGNFIIPVKEAKINSNFYARRSYNNVKSSPHRGVDLKGKKGDPIYAIQDGKVELAGKMFFEGKLTIINHGNKVYSLYMHQSKTLVKKGDIVKKGHLIGKIGSTGMSTGPHLHLAVKVKDTYIDPLSLISLNIF